MNKTVTTIENKCERYSVLKDCSSEAEKDDLILGILEGNPDYCDAEQIDEAFNKWQNLQNKKINKRQEQEIYICLIIQKLFEISDDVLHVGLRDMLDSYEFWVITKECDCLILDEIFEIYNKYSPELDKHIDFIHMSQNEFVGKENYKFLTFI